MADAKARLTSLFTGGANGGGGNDALRYVAPKEPTRQSAQQPPPQQQQAPAAANAVVFSTTVSMYQFDSAARKYVQLGTAASKVVGCVIVGSEVTYGLLFYNADKQPLCEIPMRAWKPTVQPKQYINFYDERGANWSVKFASDDALVEFMRQVFLAKIHSEIWGSSRSIDANSLLQQDLGAAAIKDDGSSGAPSMAAGDTVAVEFKCWRVVGNARCAPNEVVTKYPPFEKTNDGELRKFRIGDGAERIKALEEAVIGMKRGGKRMVLAPPGKTNGQDWYLLEITLVKTKTGGSSSRSDAERRASTNSVAAAGDTEGSSSSSSSRKSRRKTTNNADLVPYDVDTAGKDALELKELQLKQREKELEIQQKAFESARMSMANGAPGGGSSNNAAAAAAAAATAGMGPAMPQMNSMGFAPYAAAPAPAYNPSPYGANLFSPQPIVPGLVSSTGRPLDALMMELHAKVDYLIRMAPAGGSGSSSSVAASLGIGVGATDVQGVLRGVERLAGENERLLLQINSQNQQYTAYEKRCEELLKQNQRLQDEKRQSDEKYQSIASQQLNFNAEIANLTSARDAAITQTNRLHAEYQQLLTAFYQKQQVSSEAEEQRNELTFERQARQRLEKELNRETQAKSLVEQELTLIKKQLDVFTKLKESEQQTQRQDWEKQFQALQAKDRQEAEERVRQVVAEHQQREARLQEELQSQLDRQSKLMQTQLENLQQQLETAQTANARLVADITQANSHIEELQAQAVAASKTEDSEQLGLADEEKRIYVDQIELLQQQVKELETEKFQRVQQEMDSGRLSSPASSPRNGSRKVLEIVDDAKPCAQCEAVARREEAARAKEVAAERAVEMAEQLKREAADMIAVASNSTTTKAADPQQERETVVTLFKEAVNEMFFRFQDVFEDDAATALEGRQVLTVIRKVLKQSTKDVIQRLQQPSAASASPASSDVLPTVAAVAATSVAAGVVLSAVAEAPANGSGDEDSSDEPPPPPDQDMESVPSAIDDAVAVNEAMDEARAVNEPQVGGEPDSSPNTNALGDVEDDDEDVAAVATDDEDLLFGAASVSKSSLATVMTQEAHSRRTTMGAKDTVSSDEEDDFED
ncbi:hypothetical protein P43SY_007825 [Pythium insidiosum]|uniref:Uncharacterized protein n=1 Tax=Pythium insidiosum TaxID=114742 RepID=A0AAD5Q857_PYTIN|nr:hypothetical protein P43SY_007825 [Pythium insidiosum]